MKGGMPILLAAAAESALPVGPLVALLVFGIALLLVLILRFKLQAFISLIVVSAVVAAVSKFVNPDAVPLTQVAPTIVNSMGGALGFIATIIGIGAIFGAILGAVIIQLVKYTLLANGVEDEVALIAKAVIIILAVWVQQFRRA